MDVVEGGFGAAMSPSPSYACSLIGSFDGKHPPQKNHNDSTRPFFTPRTLNTQTPTTQGTDMHGETRRAGTRSDDVKNPSTTYDTTNPPKTPG